MTKEGRLKKDANNGGPYKIKWFVPCEAQFATGRFWGRLLMTYFHKCLVKRELECEFGEALLGMMLWMGCEQ
jgi:hypothetical protein